MTEPESTSLGDSYPGERLGLPAQGTNSLAGMGLRFAALVVDWLIAYGLALLVQRAGLLSPHALSSAVLIIWLAIGVLTVRLYGFTPGQFVLGLKVISVDERIFVGTGRALVRGLLLALVVPALLTDSDGRGLQDRLTATAVVHS